MTNLQQLPAELNIEIAISDDFSYLFDFDINLTSYTFEGAVSKSPNGELTEFTIVETDLSTGQITVSLTYDQINALGVGTHTWYLSWTVSSTTRKVLAGNFTVKDYP
jgi:hypothetical protein